MAILYSFTITFGFSIEAAVFVPFISMMAVRMGYDPIVAVATVVFAVAIGYAGSLTGPFNIAVAQEIAGLPMYSGLWYRAICSVILFTIAAWYLLNYANKVKKDPSKSLVSHIDYSKIQMTVDPAKYVMTGMQKRVLIVFGASFGFVAYAMLELKFGMADLTAYFLIIGILVGILARMKAGTIADTFIEGAKSLIYPAMLIGWARGLETILSAGMVMDSMINAIVQPLTYMPTVMAPGMMLFVQSIINLFIPSASAMAMVTMPIMTPLADLLHVQRQTAVFAFQFGDGITNLILPSWATLITCLGLANVPFGFRKVVQIRITDHAYLDCSGCNVGHNCRNNKSRPILTYESFASLPGSQI
jgi:uncharacterized ion transporter superfamily protein YfcC